MSAARNRLVNALRRSMLQRTALRRQADTARAAFKPSALIDRGKYRLQAKVDDTAQAVRDEFRSNRLPIALAAVAGTLWLLREPIKDLGLHDVTVVLHPEVEATITMNVARSAEEAELQAQGKSIQDMAAEADAEAEFEIAELFDDIGGADDGEGDDRDRN